MPNQERPEMERCQRPVMHFTATGEWDKPCVLVAGHYGHCADEAMTPDAGSYDEEAAFNCETEKYDRRAVRVKCPGCGRIGSPLCSPKTERTRAEWRWVGLDHKQPEADYRTTCRCGQVYTFTTYISQ